MKEISLHIDWMTPSSFELLATIPIDWESLDLVTIQLCDSHFDTEDTHEQDGLRTFLNESGIKNLTLESFGARKATILPSCPLEKLTLQLDARHHEGELYYEELLSPPMPPAARVITVRDLVCYQDFSGPPDDLLRSDIRRPGRSGGLTELAESEEENLAALFSVLGKPCAFNMVRSRIHPQLMKSMLGNTLGRGLTRLSLDELVRRNDSQVTLPSGTGQPYSLNRLVNLRHLRLGAIDGHLIADSPPNLESLTLLFVNTLGAVHWLVDVIDIPADTRLPVECTISISADVTFPKLDGPDAVLEPRKASGQAETLEYARGMDLILAGNGRSLETGSFEATAVKALARYVRRRRTLRAICGKLMRRNLTTSRMVSRVLVTRSRTQCMRYIGETDIEREKLTRYASHYNQDLLNSIP